MVKLFSVMLLSLFIIGCGGGSSSSTDPSKPNSETPITKIISGIAVDGYISGAEVCLDINENDLTIDPQQDNKKLQNLDAIVVVHIFGIPANSC